MIPALLAAAAIALRAFVWQRTQVVFNDGPAFLAIAHAFERGDVAGALSHPYHPLYSLLVAGVRRALALEDPGALVRAAGVVSVLSGGVAVVALYAWLRRLFDARLALAGALLLVVHPLAVQFASDVQSDGVALALQLAAAAALARALARAAPGAALGCGLLSGLAYLTRPEGAEVAVVGAGIGAALCAWPAPIARRAPEIIAPASRGRWLVWTLALGLGAGLAIAPYVGWLYRETGELRLSGKKSLGELTGAESLAGGPVPAPALPPAPPPALHPATVRLIARAERAREPGAAEADAPARVSAALEGPSVGADAARAREAPALAAAPPKRGAVAALRDLLATLLSAARPEIVLLLALGLFVARGRAGGRALLVLALAGLRGLVLFGLAWHAGYVSRRHALPPLVLAFGWAALGARALGAALLAGLDRLRPTAVVRARAGGRALALGTALALVVGVGHALRPPRESGLAARIAAEWLRVAGPPDAGAVAVEKSRDAWYAGRPFVPLRDAPEAAPLAWLCARGTRFVIVDEATLARRPGLAAALARDGHLLQRAEANGTAARALALCEDVPAAAADASRQAE